MTAILANEQVSDADVADAISRLTPSQAAEFLSLREFAASFWSVKTKSSGFRRVKLNRAQLLLDAEYERQMSTRGWVRLDCLKARQMGGTAYWIRRALHDCIIRAGRTALTIADKKETPSEWLAQATRNYQETPECLRPELGKAEAGHQLAFQNGSRYYIGSAQGGFPGVGDTIHFLHLSEACWWDKPPISKDPDEVLLPLWPAVPSGSDITGSVVAIDSTGVMVGDWRHKHWLASKSGQNGYAAIFVPWFLVETYRRDDLSGDVTGYSDSERLMMREAQRHGVELDAAQVAWYRDVLRGEFHGDETECGAAYPATEEQAFMAPGLTVYKANHVVAAKATERQPIWKGNVLGDGDPAMARFDPNESGEMRVWEWPRDNYHYVLGADCQWGKRKESDFDVLYVECLETGKLCAKVKGHYPLNHWGWVIQALGWKYNCCPVAPETNGQVAATGMTVISVLLGNVGSYRYPNIYVRSDDQALRGHRPDDYGWWTTAANKGQLIAYSQEQTLNGEFDWCDQAAVDQMATIIRKADGAVEAPEGMHDDDWMARLITGYVAHRERGRTQLYVEPKPKVFRMTSMEARLAEHFADRGNEDGEGE